MKSLNYEDVYLIPEKCVVNSRSECDTRARLGSYIFDLPVIPANMPSLVTSRLIDTLYKRGYFYIQHRFGVDNGAFIAHMRNKMALASISIGLKEADFRFVRTHPIVPDFVTIDVAHGDSDKMCAMIEAIRFSWPNTFVIAGNIGTGKAAQELEYAGAHAIKVGIAPGSLCTTYQNTGFVTPMFSTIMDISQYVNIPIIADGGIKNYGDIAKALTAGATMVMVGGLLMGHEETAGRRMGDMVEVYGSASKLNKSDEKHIEGATKLVPYKHKSILDTYREIKEALQSAISYAGGKDLRAFSKVLWQTFN